MSTERLLSAFFPAMAKTGAVITAGLIDNFSPVIDPQVLPQQLFPDRSALRGPCSAHHRMEPNGDDLVCRSGGIHRG